MKQGHRELILIAIIILAALSVRIWGVHHYLPFIYHPDEPRYVAIIQTIFKTGDLNPHFFNYPSLFLYINSLAYIPYYLVGEMAGVFTSRSDIMFPVSLAMGVAQSPMPSTILLGRCITVIFGVGAVALTYAIGKRLSGSALVGLLASLMLAFSPTNVAHSRFITPDTFVVFFAAASFLAAVLVYQQGKTRHYIMAGICVGLTASSKYNGALIFLPLLFAHFLRHGKTGFKERNLYLALAMCALGFLAATPYALIDASKFLADLSYESQHYSSGHAGEEGDALTWYLGYMWQTAGIVYVLAALEILRGFLSRSREIILLSIFPAVYFAFISSFEVRNDRTLLPLTPFLFLLAASFLAHWMSRTAAIRSNKLRQFSVLAIIGLAIAGLSMPASKTIKDTIRLTRADSRETARIWINSNLPAGSRLAIESYSPFVDPSRFYVQRIYRMINHEPDWYVEQGLDYLVFSQGMYGRFYQDAERYLAECAQYDNLFRQFQLVKLFTDGGYEVRVYKVR
jgi:4-amino-4-deoxy-L-arabinose transferase-like glycosyltransferase